MATYTGFIDITGFNFSKAPLVKGGVRAVYVTGSGGIEETAAQIAQLKAAGMGAITIDQTPGLTVFASGGAAVADVEPFAGTDWSARVAVAARQSRGQSSTLYCSYSNWPALKGSIASPVNVSYWIADYSWSQAEAEAFIAGHPDVAAVQYGDPNSNPRTLVPGTNVDLAQAQADIDIALTSWTDRFLTGTQPAPPTILYGDTGGWVKVAQTALNARHSSPVLTADGDFGPETLKSVVHFQGAEKIGVDGIIGPVTWGKLGY